MRSVSVLVLLFLLLFPHAVAQPRVKLSAETVAAFDSYVEDAEGLLRKRLDGELPFLWTDDDPQRRLELRDGRILIETPPQTPDIKGGLLHVWLGAMFVPDATGPQILEVLQDYDRHQDWYPEVVESKLLGRDGETLRAYQRLLKKKVLTVVLSTEHEARYRQVSEGRWVGGRSAPRSPRWRTQASQGKGSSQSERTGGFCGGCTFPGASRKPKGAPLSKA